MGGRLPARTRNLRRVRSKSVRSNSGLDAGNGLWKLGARFYDSGKNAFIQQDRYLGDLSDPLSLNRYVYCELDPVNFVDPTGFMPQYIVTDVTAIQRKIHILNTMALKAGLIGTSLSVCGTILGITLSETIIGGYIGGIIAAYGGGLAAGAYQSAMRAQALDTVATIASSGGYFVITKEKDINGYKKVIVYDKNGGPIEIWLADEDIEVLMSSSKEKENTEKINQE